MLHRKVKSKAGEPPAAQPPMKVLGRLFSYVTRYTLEIVGVIALLLLSTVLNLLIPYWLGVGLNNLSSAPDPTAIAQLAIGMVIAAICSWGAMLWQSLMLNRVVQRALYRLRQELFERMQRLSLNFFDRQSIGELMSRVTNDTDVVAQFFRNSLNSLVSETLQLVFLVLAMFLLNWKMAIAALTIAPMVVVFLGFISQIAGPVFANLQEQIGELNGLLEETVSGQKVAIAYGRQEEAIATFEDVSKLVRDAGVKARLLALVSRPVTLVLTNLDVALVALVGGLLTLQGQANVGVVATFLQYTRQFSIPIGSLANNLDGLLAAIAAAERIFSILDERPAIVDQPNAPEMPPIQGHVVARDVDFSYVQGRPILKHNTFEARPGEKIGLCGPTGAGKSTIINLMTRYYDLDGGEILIDGHNIATVQQDSLRRQIGIVLQEAFLFSDTVMNNLRYARLDATEQDCIEATKQANAHDFILHLPDGYNTMLTERGSNLSQGQRQLLTIARMMIQNPRMVILDEATSNVDTRTEQKIQEALDRLMQGRTSFVIAHRLSTIRNADQILVLKAGEIIETGSHDELMQKQGFYYDLFMSQFKGKLVTS
ncbi:ABC transporter ATP-binding protein [Scytonema hofmannii]|uniref:ABC transporter ATP-binding protein n=1 Tax=Scytonema hofmannii TaxID=34078 RepID=UPI0013140A04|nr:ABC transporter ATP-binding protein [Scytonema hofmannii]